LATTVRSALCAWFPFKRLGSHRRESEKVLEGVPGRKVQSVTAVALSGGKVGIIVLSEWKACRRKDSNCDRSLAKTWCHGACAAQWFIR